jgi:predicted transcriptional regulator
MLAMNHTLTMVNRMNVIESDVMKMIWKNAESAGMEVLLNLEKQSQSKRFM